MTNLTLYTMRSTLILALLIVSSRSALGQMPTEFVQTAPMMSYHIVPSSTLEIHGTSSVNSFECNAEVIREVHNQSDPIQGTGFTVPGVSIVIPVHELDCDNRRMNKDLRDALKAEEHPEIRFDVVRIILVPGNEANADMESDIDPSVTVEGRLSLAGVTREVRVEVESDLDEALRLHGRGSLDLKMTDFDVEPPTALFGLVKARDEITIHFHLVAELTDPNSL